MKGFLKFYATRKFQSKKIPEFRIMTTSSAGNDMEHLEPPNGTLFSMLVWQVIAKLNILSPCDSAIMLWGPYPKEYIIYRISMSTQIFIIVFTADFSSIAKYGSKHMSFSR